MRALAVSYAFPPVGGAGVQRVLKLVKYAHEHGMAMTVLTSANPSVPLRDPSLLDEVPEDVEVIRARTLEPSYRVKRFAWQTEAKARAGLLSSVRARGVRLAKSCLFPDPQVLWLPGALRALLRRLLAHDIDVVFVSGPPFSQFLLALAARLRPGTAVVLDYRDEWTTTRQVYEMAGRAPLLLERSLERQLLRSADAVTTATEAFRQELLARFDFLAPESVVTIENGFDPADFPEQLPEPPQDRLVLTYVGTVFRLTSPAGLLEALRILRAREPNLSRLLEVRFVGRIVDTELGLFDASEALGVTRVGYVEHARAIEELATSHLALCVLDAVAGAERVYPAKIFEIMKLGRRCLALCPKGAFAELIETHRLGQVIAPRDAEAIARFLAAELVEFRATGHGRPSSAIDIDRFDRRLQAGRFAAVFASAVRRVRADSASARSFRARLNSASSA